VVVTAFGITDSAGYVVKTHDFSLIRSGNRYSAIFQTDGNPSFPWRAYFNGAMELIDTNDTNSNGIPDFSDSIPPVPLGVTHIGIVQGGQIQLQIQGPLGKT
jgi:hypothetical protein